MTRHNTKSFVFMFPSFLIVWVKRLSICFEFFVFDERSKRQHLGLKWFRVLKLFYIH
jgi:hypothetical protein